MPWEPPRLLGLLLRLRPIGLALRVLRLRPIGLALRVLRLRPIGLALRVLRLRPIGLALRVLRLRPIGLALRGPRRHPSSFRPNLGGALPHSECPALCHSMIRTKGLTHIHLIVRDMERSPRFY